MTGSSDTEGPANRGGPRDRGHLCAADWVVIRQAPGSERIVKQTVDVPATMERMTPGVPQIQRLRRVVQVAVGISQERVQQHRGA